MPYLKAKLEISRCPYCGIDKPNVDTASVFETNAYDGANKRTWRAYMCRNCGGVITASAAQDNALITAMLPAQPIETFELKYLPPQVAEDFAEALICYSNSALNAFAAMARRTVQSMSADLGAKGKDKVLQQLRDLKDVAQIDDETFEILSQVIIAGHDGAHPYLPKLTPERAGVLLELMKDVLRQVYVRKAKIQEAIELRKRSITQAKPETVPEGVAQQGHPADALRFAGRRA
jgi:hypothetical protein